MSKRQGVSKWQIKSTRVNQIRWELENLLEEDFSPEEKESEKYAELVESIDTVFKHVVPKSKRDANRNVWKMTLLISLATSGGAIVIKLIEFLTAFFSGSATPGGTP